MTEGQPLQRFWDATLGDEPVDHEAFLREGVPLMSKAIELHQLLQSAAEVWKKPAAPRQLGRFQVISELGAGGMGRVYLAWDPDLRRYVAIKVIARDHWAVNEARSIAQLDHHSIVKVYEVGHDRLVMELLDGGSLQEKVTELRAGEPSFLIPLRARLHCLVRIAEGLAYCHERGILHRDVKPGNVLFAKDDEHPRLVDFGLAHLDELESLDITQNLVGTPAYLAPEQIEAGETGTDARSDIFSFGVLAYELLTLESPFVRETRTATLEAVSAAHPRAAHRINNEIQRPVTHIIEHCLELVPGRRYGSMQEVVRDLNNALANQPISVGSRSPIHRVQLYFQRNRLAAGFATAGVGLATLLGTGLWLTSLSTERMEFKRQIESILARVPETHTSAALHDTGMDLFNAQSKASGLDDSWIGRHLFQGSESLVTGACELWSRHLSKELEAIQSFETGSYPPDNWRSLVYLDARLLPDAEWNQELRERGAVLLSEELEDRRAELVIYRQVSAGPGKQQGQAAWQQTQLVRFPQIGYYRLEIPGEWQVEFVLKSPWGEPISLQLQERKLDSGDWLDWESRGYLVSPPISNQQFERYREDMGIDYKVIGDPKQAVSTSHERAMGFAAWAGGRIPTAQELAVLSETDVLVLDTLLNSEFVSNLPPLGGISTSCYFRYARWRDNRDEVSSMWTGLAERTKDYSPEDAIHAPEGSIVCGFRILYPRTF